ncbi:putative glucose-methanol-choline oxidoreductase [Phaeosphaeriaceae sp. PMI808]|nr:putative glucose-methanol-choline oxidoreductase [Phaeosphaeriaceae sp. PMI808]
MLPRSIFVLPIALLVSIVHAQTTLFPSLGLLGSYFGVPGQNATFDYVVIGGGTAGLTLANRLSAKFSVAVIEAGDFYEFANGNNSQVPAYASTFTGSNPVVKNPALDWYMYTEPQMTLNNQKLLFDSGKVVGGSSARNFLWYIRGSRGAFDKWASDVDDQTYSFDNFLQYFQQSVRAPLASGNSQPSDVLSGLNNSDWSPHGGPIHIGHGAWTNRITSWLTKGFSELGLETLNSFASGRLLGWSFIPQTLDQETQMRSSSAEMLYSAVAKGNKISLYKSSLAKKIVFEGRKATGVAVETAGTQYLLKASKEIIVSAGVMRSPQMLMVSGVGPRSVLQHHDIEVVADLAGVGQNMMDNVLVGPTYQVNVTTHSSLSNPAYLASAVSEYNKNRTGMLTNVGGDVAGFERVKPGSVSNSTFKSIQASFPADWPNLQYLVLDAYFGTGNDSSIGLTDGKQYVAASVGLVSTFSRGNVSIRSANTAINPVISPNWLSDPRDMELAVVAFKRGRALFSTHALQTVTGDEAFPGRHVQSDDQIREAIRASANSVYNAAGTNRMGKVSDNWAVVDSKARVIGVEGLRVVDASAFPFLPPGQPQATVYALAEKIAAGILDEMQRV